MTGDPKLNYFRLQLDDVPTCMRRGLLRQFLFTAAITGSVFGISMALIWWLAG